MCRCLTTRISTLASHSQDSLWQCCHQNHIGNLMVHDSEQVHSFCARAPHAVFVGTHESVPSFRLCCLWLNRMVAQYGLQPPPQQIEKLPASHPDVQHELERDQATEAVTESEKITDLACPNCGENVLVTCRARCNSRKAPNGKWVVDQMCGECSKSMTITFTDAPPMPELPAATWIDDSDSDDDYISEYKWPDNDDDDLGLD